MNIFEESYMSNKNLNEVIDGSFEEIFDEGDEIVAIKDVFYADLDNLFFEDDDIKEYTDLGFIKNNELVFPKGTKFKILKMVGPGGWPVLTVEKTDDDFDFAGDHLEELFIKTI